MGITECDIHGTSPILPVCDHLEQYVDDDVKPEGALSVWNSLGQASPDSGEAYWGMAFCAACARARGIEVSALLSDEQFDEVDFSNTSGTCSACFFDLLTRHGMTWGDVLPAELVKTEN